ncbi:MAG: hypothetical protein R3F62_15495 [Planctomycetota bacterium]
MADEVLSRPPSHPIASTLLILSCVGTLGCIMFVWNELFTEYMPAKGTNGEIEQILGSRHGAVTIANGRKEDDVDHYRIDFGAGDMVEAIDAKLLGDDENMNAPPPAETPVEAPDEGGGDGGE